MHARWLTHVFRSLCLPVRSALVARTSHQSKFLCFSPNFPSTLNSSHVAIETSALPLHFTVRSLLWLIVVLSSFGPNVHIPVAHKQTLTVHPTTQPNSRRNSTTSNLDDTTSQRSYATVHDDTLSLRSGVSVTPSQHHLPSVSSPTPSRSSRVSTAALKQVFGTNRMGKFMRKGKLGKRFDSLLFCCRTLRARKVSVCVCARALSPSLGWCQSLRICAQLESVCVPSHFSSSVVGLVGHGRMAW